MNYKALNNLATMFFDVAEDFSQKPFLWAKENGEYVSRSYSEVASQVLSLADSLHLSGVKKGDRVVVVAENRPEWVVADLAIISIGGITVPAYTTNTAEDHLYILEHSEANIAIVSGDKLAPRLTDAMNKSATCKTIISIEDLSTQIEPRLKHLNWSNLVSPKDKLKINASQEAANLKRDDIACFIYTSGTGGNPKGVMLTHGSILANCSSAYDLLTEFGLGDEIFLSLLPLSHSYEHTCGLYFPISIGAQIYYSEGPDKVAQNLQEASPTIMTAVPRLYEALHDRIQRGVHQSGGFKERLFNLTLELGRKEKVEKQSLNFSEKLQNKVVDFAVRSKVSQRFGGRLKAFVSGGAALNPDIGNFFLSLGVNILQGYGQTEASPIISCNRPGNIRIETVGPALTEVEIKIADDGEILVRGELVMKGYWKDPKATEDAIRDGWLHTGDIGVLEEDGSLRITDRKKDIIVNSGGDNIAPARVEGVITVEPEFLQAMVYGDKKPYLVGVVVPSLAFIEEWCKGEGDKITLSDLSGDKDFNSAVQGVMSRVNSRLSQIEKVRHIIVADEPFTTENGLMTPTLKIKRHKILQNYKQKLESLYRRS